MKISGLYIAKNEEKNIVRTINSIKEVCDEIIVVDTGSTDKTIELALEQGAKIVEYAWEQDFAKARNFAISQTTGDIIIFLDCDEYFYPILSKENKEIISKVFEEQDMDLIAINTMNIDTENNQSTFENYAHKIFRKDENIYYINPIHELLHKTNGNFNAIVIDGFKIIHEGYSGSNNIKKSERNLTILNTIENPSPMELFYLVRENLNIKNYEEAEKYATILENHTKKQTIVHESNIGFLFYLYRNTLLEIMQVPNKEELILKNLDELCELVPNLPEVYYNYGVYYFKQDLKKSEEYLLKALKLNADPNNIDINKVNNFKSFEPQIYNMLSTINYLKHNKSTAIRHAMVAYMLQRNNKHYLANIIRLMGRNQSDNNIEVLQHICNIQDKQNLQDLVSLLSFSNLRKEFCVFANQYNNHFNGKDISLLYAIMLTGHIEEALDIAVKFESPIKDFMLSVGILYSNSEIIFEKYFEVLNDDYKTAVNSFLSPDTIENNYDVAVILKDIAKQLYIMGIEVIPTKIQNLLYEKLSVSDFEDYINIFYINNDLKRIIKNIESYLNYHQELSEVLITRLLTSYYVTKKYSKFEEAYLKYKPSHLDYLYSYYLKEEK